MRTRILHDQGFIHFGILINNGFMWNHHFESPQSEDEHKCLEDEAEEVADNDILAVAGYHGSDTYETVDGDFIWIRFVVSVRAWVMQSVGKRDKTAKRETEHKGLASLELGRYDVGEEGTLLVAPCNVVDHRMEAGTVASHLSLVNVKT